MIDSHDCILLFGGASSERRVSVASAQNLAQAIGVPRCWFWSPEGAIIEVAPASLRKHARPFEVDFKPEPIRCWSTLEQALDEPGVALSPFVLALHGVGAEDGVLQEELESRGIAFTGSGSASSRLAFDKVRAKACVSRAGLRVAKATVFGPGAEEVSKNRLGDLLKDWGALVIQTR